MLKPVLSRSHTQRLNSKHYKMFTNSLYINTSLTSAVEPITIEKCALPDNYEACSGS